MRSSISTSCCVGIVVLAFLTQTVAMPSPAFAQWQPRDDDLPGTISTGELLLGALAVAAVVVLVFVVSNKMKAEEPEKTEEAEEEGEEEAEEEAEEWESSSSLLWRAREQFACCCGGPAPESAPEGTGEIPVALFGGVGAVGEDLSERSFSVGVSVRF